MGIMCIQEKRSIILGFCLKFVFLALFLHIIGYLVICKIFDNLNYDSWKLVSISSYIAFVILLAKEILLPEIKNKSNQHLAMKPVKEKE